MADENRLTSKYNISEEDLYTLAIIEAKKGTVGFLEKEKLKAKSMGVLKPYDVKFMDLGNLLDEIKKKGYHNNQALIDKYGEIDLDTKSSSTGLKYFIPLIVGVVVFFYVYNSSTNDSSATTSYNTTTNTSTGTGKTSTDAGLEESKRVYNIGYSDGQTGYGLPASSRATADEYYMSRGYNFSSADYYVYKMGYNDGIYGRKKRY